MEILPKRLIYLGTGLLAIAIAANFSSDFFPRGKDNHFLAVITPKPNGTGFDYSFVDPNTDVKRDFMFPENTFVSQIQAGQGLLVDSPKDGILHFFDGFRKDYFDFGESKDFSIFDLSLSPNGKGIVAVGIEKSKAIDDQSPPTGYDLIVQFLGQEKHTIAKHKSEMHTPTFSPDSKKIAYWLAAGDEHSHDDQLKIVSLDGQEVASIAIPQPLFSGYEISWSPDSQKIAIQVNHTNQSDQVLLCDVATQTCKQLPFPNGDQWYPTWVNKNELAIICNANGKDDIFVMDENEVVRQITFDGQDKTFLNGEPDGQLLAYSDANVFPDVNDNVWLFNVETGETKLLMTGYLSAMFWQTLH